MECGLLFSGGKDSSLAALMLEPFYDVTLKTAHFGITEDWQYAQETAAQLGIDFSLLELDVAVAESAVERMSEDGFPRNGIQMVHLHALESIATERFDAIADGTRRDDRVPSISRAQVQSLENRHGVDYLAPLSGFGRRAVDRLVDITLTVDVGPSEQMKRADYEAELRALLADIKGEDVVRDVFPSHEQTHVRGYR